MVIPVQDYGLLGVQHNKGNLNLAFLFSALRLEFSYISCYTRTYCEASAVPLRDRMDYTLNLLRLVPIFVRANLDILAGGRRSCWCTFLLKHFIEVLTHLRIIRRA